MTTYRFKAIRAKQADGHDVFSFAATPEEILAFSEIERVGRNDDGDLKGFQRHQVAAHIREIRDYLSRDDALLPNSVIIAFIEGVNVTDHDAGVVSVEINTKRGKPGYIVDGQQRLTALSGISKPDFQVFVSALVCKDYNELRQQFVLINNTRPLPKTLIYELLPTVEGLPDRFSSRKFSARIVDKLNFLRGGALQGEIRQHTNPKGVLSDTAMQKIVMNSSSDGFVRELFIYDDYEAQTVKILNDFFSAVANIFRDEWVGMSPKTSRLRHGAGLVAMGFVLEVLQNAISQGAIADFETGLHLLKKHTAWTKGSWHFSDTDIRPWNGVQNTPADIQTLSNYLIKVTKRELRTYQKRPAMHARSHSR